MRDFGDDVFKGTAQYYAKCQEAYPRQIFMGTIDKFNLDGSGRLLDLGCSTSALAISPAKHF
jgi:cyclopropane fatty-acyl-phospholipid synthase-like methyltransferase